MLSTLLLAALTSVTLPPELPWTGASEALIVSAGDEWITPAEREGLERTPGYDETVAWLRHLVDASPRLAMTSLGRSAEGRDIWMVIASDEGGDDPARLRRNGRPTVLVHAGIHAGEIDGKDAGLMLLRDMTVGGTKGGLLKQANLLFIPILNVDGHERRSLHGRMNQRGPERPGWRTNARNLNLNRDYAKLETEEVRALVAAVVRWRPDLYVDVHVTDGVDYEYDVTYGYNGRHAWSPRIARWLDERFRPAVDAALEGQGHLPGPLIFARNGRDLSAGIFDWTARLRFSNGWGDARHLPTVLVENHSLKPYRQRVLGTYVFLESALRAAGTNAETLREATAADRAAAPVDVVMAWSVAAEPTTMPAFRGVRSELVDSPIMGTPVARWTGKRESRPIQVWTTNVPAEQVRRPESYYVPPAWRPIADMLARQGIVVERIDESRSIEVERYRLPEAALDAAGSPYEGRARFTSGTLEVERVTVEVPAGSFRVRTGQGLGTLAVLLLEPASPDSYFQWGYFASVLQRTEYFEAYALEPLAQEMLAGDPELLDEFRQRLLDDASFAGDSRARLDWFYERTPYLDERYRVYPVLRSVD